MLHRVNNKKKPLPFVECAADGRCLFFFCEKNRTEKLENADALKLDPLHFFKTLEFLLLQLFNL